MSELLAYFLGILCLILLGFMIMYSLIPTAAYGTWSSPIILPCNGDAQNAVSNYVYSCSPNPITGFGCKIPSSDDITYKNLIIQQSCSSSNLRNISNEWRAVDGSFVSCRSENKQCCAQNENCYTETSYCCATIGPTGGENRCTLYELDGYVPADNKFDPYLNNGYNCADPSKPTLPIRRSCAPNC